MRAKGGAGSIPLVEVPPGAGSTTPPGVRAEVSVLPGAGEAGPSGAQSDMGERGGAVPGAPDAAPLDWGEFQFVADLPAVADALLRSNIPVPAPAGFAPAAAVHDAGGSAAPAVQGPQGGVPAEGLSGMGPAVRVACGGVAYAPVADEVEGLSHSDRDHRLGLC